MYALRQGGISSVVVIIGVCVITALLIGGMIKLSERKTQIIAEQTSREVAEICTTDMATQFHIHPKLSIVINGTPYTIPADIGIENGCMHPLHTHDTTGELHVESPVQKDFTLGDFFYIWKQPFDSMHLLDKTATHEGQITMTINGDPVTTFENTVLKDLDKIIINYTE